MVNVRNDYSQFQTAGGEVIAVTMGTPEQVAAFRQQLRLPFSCLSDPGRVAYRAFGVPAGTMNQVAGPGVWLAGLRALFRGGVGVPRGDLHQLHATFVVDPRGVIRFAHRPRHSADFAATAAVVAALANPG